MVLNNATDIRLGSTQVSAVYLGSNLVWPTTPPPAHDYSQDYLTFKALEQGTFSCDVYSVSEGGDANLYYSLDNGQTWNILSYNANTPTLNTGDTIIWKYSFTPYSDGTFWNIPFGGNFSSTGNFEVYGNVMSLAFGDNFANKTSLYENGNNLADFIHLFANCTKLIYANNLILPALTLCSDCYYDMFRNCTNLLSAPQLPATTLAKHCYQVMFADCTNLTTAPDLLAPTLTQSCYQGMFSGCSSLNYIKCLATDISATDCTLNWTWGVPYGASANGTFVKDTNTTWSINNPFGDGDDGIPFGWTIVNNGTSLYTITLVDSDNIGLNPTNLQSGGYQSGTYVSIEFDSYYPEYENTESNEYIISVSCSNQNVNYYFTCGNESEDETILALLEITSMPAQNITFTFEIIENPDYVSGGDEEEPEEEPEE